MTPPPGPTEPAGLIEPPDAPRGIAARLVGVTKIHGRGDAAVRALDRVDLTVFRHRLTAIVGPSGSGKSTLLHCLAGLDRPTSGQVLFGGTDLTSLGDSDLAEVRRDRVGFVFQAYNLVPVLTVEENVRLPLKLAGRRVDQDWFDEIVATLDLGDRLRRRPHELSGGQQQRAAIARAMLARPDLVVADEPTGNLDTSSGTAVLDLLVRCVTDGGQTIVMVTHDAVAAARADRVVFLRDGAIEGDLHDSAGLRAEDVVDTLRRLDERAAADP